MDCYSRLYSYPFVDLFVFVVSLLTKLLETDEIVAWIVKCKSLVDKNQTSGFFKLLTQS